MDIEIKNICSIKEAKIKFDGLTIIAGENDTGKSTVGKLIFSIVKAINRYEEDFSENKEFTVRNLIDSIYFDIRKSSKPQELEILREEFSPHFFFRQLRAFIEPEAYKQIALFELDDKEKDLDFILDKKIKIINTFELKNKEKIIQTINKIKIELTKNKNEHQLIVNALTKAFNSEFYFEITPKNNKEATSLLNCAEGENKIFALKIKNDAIKEFELFDQILFNDVTFIETPVVLQMYDLISQARTLFELDSTNQELFSSLKASRGKVALHTKDLISKLENAQYLSGVKLSHFEQNSFFLNKLADIENIMKGKFTFQRREREFIFSKKTSKESINVKSSNTASGIKTFGLIQLLIQAGIIKERSLLVIDEPENHLHPEWQVKYAELIVELVKNNVYVVISSHSPYMIQALKIFSERAEIADKTNFYLAEKNEKTNFTKIKDVTKDLNQIFIKLSQPFQDLVW